MANTLSATDVESDNIFETYIPSNKLINNAPKVLDQVEIYNMLGQFETTSIPSKRSTIIDLIELNTGRFKALVGNKDKIASFKFLK